MISVIVPIYNNEKYLKKCIESIIKQTYIDTEIILIDDGSTDGSRYICDKYAVSDNRIRVIHKQNEGLVKARKTGLSNVKGEYIAYVDGDDWIEQNMLMRLYETLIAQSVDIVMYGRFEDTGDTSREVFHGFGQGRYNKEALIDQIYPRMIVNGGFFEWGLFPGVWDKLWKRDALFDYQMDVDDRLSMGEDAVCTYPAILNADSIYILHECFYHYRQTRSSMVKRKDNAELQREKFIILYNSGNKLLEKYIDIYDLREQWLEYVLFLMVPRAEILYRGIEELDFLFPFSGVPRGSNIIIYGMGTYGQLLYRFIQNNEFCNILACVDKNYIELAKQGFSVVSPDHIDNYQYDAIVVASSFVKVRTAIYKDLCDKYPKEKIYLMDEALIKDSESLQAFGLIESEKILT